MGLRIIQMAIPTIIRFSVIVHIESQLAAKATEPQWQKLFEANPFILDMAFNVPVLLLQGQAHVGGKILDGSGEKIADFLFTNQLTDSIAILEIKTPAWSWSARSNTAAESWRPPPSWSARSCRPWTRSINCAAISTGLRRLTPSKSWRPTASKAWCWRV